VSRVAQSALDFAASTITFAGGLIGAFVIPLLALCGFGPERPGVLRAAAERGGFLGLPELVLTGALGPVHPVLALKATGNRFVALLGLALGSHSGDH
jgi:hypothetical protein